MNDERVALSLEMLLNAGWPFDSLIADAGEFFASVVTIIAKPQQWLETESSEGLFRFWTNVASGLQTSCMFPQTSHELAISVIERLPDLFEWVALRTASDNALEAGLWSQLAWGRDEPPPGDHPLRRALASAISRSLDSPDPRLVVDALYAIDFLGLKEAVDAVRSVDANRFVAPNPEVRAWRIRVLDRWADESG